MHRQLYEELRAMMLDGRLAPGRRIPATRLLARELGVSRNTVAGAFDQLRAEGYLESRERGGTFVAARLPDALLRASDPSTRALLGKWPSAPSATSPPENPAVATLSRRGRVLQDAARPELRVRDNAVRPFRSGLPAVDEFPRRIWSRLLTRRWRGGSVRLAYGDAEGDAALVAAIAEYVRTARGVRCTVDQVLVVSGSQQALDLAARVLLDPGDVAWVEDPGYWGVRAALAAAGAVTRLVPVDGEGLDLAAAMAAEPAARVVCVAPSHQFPLGVTMSATRRLELLGWARARSAWILEDDYDSEYRYASRPLAALQGLDRSGCVVYIGTFSKTMFPALRLGYMIAPDGIVDALRAARAAADRHSPALEQGVLADFIGEGHYARHVRRMRALYEERRDALRDAVERRLGDLLALGPMDAGMHTVGWLPEGLDDRKVAEALLGEGVDTAPLSRYWAGAGARSGLILGYAAYRPDVIRAAVERMAPVLERALATTRAPSGFPSSSAPPTNWPESRRAGSSSP
jgi:GntR family transcriptional regulator/MocR family aminotransferase